MLQITRQELNANVMYTTGTLFRNRFAYFIPASDAIFFNIHGILGKGLRDSIRSSGYTPNGDETVKGLCADAGNLIRELFKVGLEDPTLRFSLLVTENKIRRFGVPVCQVN